MTLADYRLCDVCEAKTFYDARLDWAYWAYSGEWHPVGWYSQRRGSPPLLMDEFPDREP